MPSATQLYSTGRWLNASDLANNANIGLNKRVPAFIHSCEPELIGQGNDQKTMLMLDLVSKQGQAWPKKLPLNKSNTMVMVASFGDDYSSWGGKAIEIWAENVMFSGKLVPGLKVQAANNGNAIPASAPAQHPSPSATAATGIPSAASPAATLRSNTAHAPNMTDVDDDAIPF